MTKYVIQYKSILCDTIQCKWIWYDKNIIYNNLKYHIKRQYNQIYPKKLIHLRVIKNEIYYIQNDSIIDLIINAVRSATCFNISFSTSSSTSTSGIIVPVCVWSLGIIKLKPENVTNNMIQ